MNLDPLQTGFRHSRLTDVGRIRSGNEDYSAAVPECGIFVVCDGMGGAAAGEVASELAAATFVEHLKTRMPTSGDPVEPLLQEAVEAANSAVYDLGMSRPGLRGMGTTLVALLLQPPSTHSGTTLWLAHVGDSRCYRLRAGELLPLTVDHSLVQEQILAGQLTPEEAETSPVRNIITRAVGSAPEVQADVRRLTPEPGDLFLLASDGLTRELPDEAIAAILNSRWKDLDDLCLALINAANAAGGHDNITVLLLGMEH